MEPIRISARTRASCRAAYARHDVGLPAGLAWLSMCMSTPDPAFLYVYLFDPDNRLRLQWLCKAGEEAVCVVSDPVLFDIASAHVQCRGLSPASAQSGHGAARRRDPWVTQSCGAVGGVLPAGTWRLEVLSYAAASHAIGVLYEVSLEGGSAGDVTATLARGSAERPWIDEASETAPDSRVVRTVQDFASRGAAAASSAALAYDAYDWTRTTGRSTGLGWYRGDLHMHTLLSDGQQTAPALHALASARRLDFIVITEHNLWTTAWVQDDVLILPGVEITSSRGHFNVIGVRRFLDLIGEEVEPRLETQTGITGLLSEARAQGALCSLNHPLLRPWHWEWDQTDIDQFDLIELWNDPTFPTNPKATERALQLFDLLWQDGHAIWGVGGSDTHMLPGDSYTPGGPPSIVGDPTTFVRAQMCSPAGLLEGLALGCVYVSRSPLLDFVIQVGDSEIVPGRCTGVEENITYEVLVHACTRVEVQWLVDGRITSVQKVERQGRAACSLHWGDGLAHWCRVEVRSEAGELLAFVNPIYNWLPESRMHRWGEFVTALDTKDEEETGP